MKKNGLLLLAVSSTDSTTMTTYLRLFQDKRKEKRDLCLQKLKYDIRKYEGYYEKLEGSARYVEYQLMNSFRALPPDKALQKSDTFYTSNKQFSNFQLEKNTWLYETSQSANYTYATGFNMARLLDKMKRPYKEQLFTNAASSWTSCWRSSAEHQTPTLLLRLSSNTVSRHTPCICPILSLRPTILKPQASCSRMLATFSGNMLRQQRPEIMLLTVCY